MKDEQRLIAYIRDHAAKHYNDGWDTIVEAWDDGDILEALSDNECDLHKTIASIQAYVDVIIEQQVNQEILMEDQANRALSSDHYAGF
jgi:hypothetical protein